MNKTVTGTIQTIAVNNLDYAVVEPCRFDPTAPDKISFTILRPIHVDMTEVTKGTVFSDFRARVYDCFGSMLKEYKYGFAKVIEHTRDGDQVTLSVLLKKD